MGCEEEQQQLSRLVDGELAAAEQVALFSHLGTCPECRGFFDSLIRFRKAARRDHEALLAEAEAALPSGAPPGAGAPVGAAVRGRRRAAAFPARVPVLVAAALAVLLVAAGVAIGIRLSSGRGAPPAHNAGSPSAPAGEPPVVLVCAMPDVVVTAPSPVKPTR